MRAIPDLTVIDPADATEIEQITLASLQWPGPIYLRMQRGKTPRLFDPAGYTAQIGRGTVLKSGGDICLVATGTMTVTALRALIELENLGLTVGLAHFHTIKPLDKPLLASLAAQYKALVTCENHSIIGGLGGAVAEACAAAHPRPIEFVGVADCFGETGSQAYLEEKFGLDVKAVIQAVRRAQARI
jgi:transketolase